MKGIFYDWTEEKAVVKNGYINRRPLKTHQVEVNDETLRDGLQNTYTRHPTLDEKLHLIQLMADLRIDSANIGFPITSDIARHEVTEIARYIKGRKLQLKPGAGARTVIKDVEAIVACSQASGIAIEAGIFIASSEIRKIVEKWDLNEIGKKVNESISFAVKNNLPVMFVTEDTTRAHPETIEFLYNIALECGARRLCVSDTVGYATYRSVFNLITFMKNTIVKENKDIKIDWHGHNDRGLATANSLAAAQLGVDRIQATALGVGERAGNASMAEVLVNLQLEGYIDKDLSKLNEYILGAIRILDFPIRPNDPVIGTDVFKTATGVHAAAVKKAKDMGEEFLAGIVYSAIDPAILGRQPDIVVGPMSGKANVEWVLQKLQIPATELLIEKILTKARQERRILQDNEIADVAHMKES